MRPWLISFVLAAPIAAVSAWPTHEVSDVQSLTASTFADLLKDGFLVSARNPRSWNDSKGVPPLTEAEIRHMLDLGLEVRVKKAKLIPANIPRTGKATANDKPMSPEEFQRLMNQGCQIGARNQLAGSEEQRCVSLIKRAIQMEWDKETFNWFPGLTPLQVQLRLGPGGRVLGFRIVGLSGSAEVDRTARAALDRVRTINGLSPSFIKQFPEIQVEMKPVGGG